MMASTAVEPSHLTSIATLLADVTESQSRAQRSGVAMLPSLLHELTEVQRHVLARAAVHRWNHRGRIPYFPATAHQRAVAWELTTDAARLLAPEWKQRGSHYRLSFRLTRLGEMAAARVLNIVPADLDRQREHAFDDVRTLMINDSRLVL